MKRCFLPLLACMLVTSWAGSAAALDPRIAASERGALPQVTPPDVRVEVLPNGMRCFLLPEHTLPVVKVRLIVKAGGIYDPADKVGLSALSGMLLRSGGAGERGPSDFDAAVDALGIRLEAAMGQDMGILSLQSLTEDLEAGLALLFDMAFTPRFDPERLEVARKTLLEALRRQDDDPSDLVGYKFPQFVYGEQSPWARRPSPASLEGISASDVRAFHARFFKAGNILLAASGDFETESLLALLRRLTADAPKGEATFPDVPAVELAFSPGTERIVRPTTQSYIRMGHLAVKRDNPDKFALIVLDEILGGGFKSRLMDDLRTRRGLAYSVWSNMVPGTDYGLLTIGVNTKADQETEATELVRRHVERLAKGGDMTQGELAFAKQSILSSFIFEFDRASKVVESQARFFFYNYPDDYLRIYHDRITASGLPDLKRVGARYLHPEGLKAVIVGPAAAATKPPAAVKEGKE